MRAVAFNEPGPAAVLESVDIPVPGLDDHDVLIKQTYAAVNYGDVTRRSRGIAQSSGPPYILGFEGVGVIESVGRNVRTLAAGDRVSYLVEGGGYAELVVAPQTSVWRVPDNVSDKAVAGITCAGLTAWGLIRQSGLKRGQLALVHGASGGVGSILVQMLSIFGVKCVALVSGTDKVTFVSRLGVAEVLDRTEDSFDEAVDRYSRKVDVVFDCVGADVLSLNLQLIRDAGVWMYFGSTSGHPSFPGTEVLMRRLNIQGFVVFNYFSDSRLWRAGTEALEQYLNANTVRSEVSKIFDLELVGNAHRLLEERKVIGKILLAI